MGTNSERAPRQRWAATGLVGCLLASGVLGVVLECEATMQPVTTTERTEQTGYVRKSEVTEVHSPLVGVTTSAGGAYLQVPSRLDYAATTGSARRLITYTVQSGDSLWVIAQTYETDISTLLSLNPDLDSTVIQPEQVLEVAPGFRGVRHIVERGETLTEIAAVYSLAVNDIESENRLERGAQLQAGQSLLLPGARDRQDRRLLASRSGSDRRVSQPPAGRQARSAGWVWPIVGGLHSSEFGQRWGGFHSGMDIAVATGTPAAAVAAGTVQFAGWDGGYGFSVILNHGSGLLTRYAHASKLLVVEGQAVKQGEDVILVGATGNSTGPHLHFEVLLDGTPQNPRLYLP